MLLQLVIAIMLCTCEEMTVKQLIDLFEREAVPKLTIIKERVKKIKTESIDEARVYDRRLSGDQLVPERCEKMVIRNARNGNWFYNNTTKLKYKDGTRNFEVVRDEVVGSNSKYSFRIRKNLDNSNYYLVSTSEPMTEEEMKANAGFWGNTYLLEEAKPSDYMVRNNDEIDKIEMGDDNVTVVYKKRYYNKQYYNSDCKVIYKPSLYWQKHAVSYYGNGNNVTISYDYEWRNGLPMISRILHKYTSSLAEDKHFEGELDFKTKYLSFDEMPEYEFTLSAFGLPEPFGITWERPRPWWIYFGLAGGGCLVGIVLIGVFLRRRYGAS